MYRQTVLLPLDKATIVVPTRPHEPTEIVLKHRDGELIRMSPTEGWNEYKLERRGEFSATWFNEGAAENTAEAAAVTADMQAFGYRRGGTPSTVVETHEPFENELLEIEPLDRGGILIDSNEQLPVVLHRRDHTFWRARGTHDTEGEIPAFGGYDWGYVIERKDDESVSWERVEAFHQDLDAASVIEKLAEIAGVESITQNPTGEHIDSVLDAHVFWFDKASNSDAEQAWRERTGVQENTVLFEDEVPDSFSFDE